MPPFEESGLRVTLPEVGSFRFSACATYHRLSGRQVTEMDVGWWDEARQAIYLLEIKDYSRHEAKKDLRSNLIAKGRDCLVMLHASWRDVSDVGRALLRELPERCRTPQRLRLFFVLKDGDAGHAKELIPAIKDDLENHIKAYAELLGMGRLDVVLLDHVKAIEKGLPITVIEPLAPVPPPPPT